jgi:lipopolysaccharide cholinephosphotransferase
MPRTKVQIRSNKQLKIRKLEFIKICKILDKLKIKYFLQTGILLGAIRDNDLIKWDWDIEISVFSNEFEKKIDHVAKKLEKEFSIININKKHNDFKIDFLGKYNKHITTYTIFAWNYSKKKKIFWRKEFIVPEKFLLKFSKIKFLGKKFNCPYKPKEYLTYAYGNWKIPLRTSNKEKYLTKNFKNKYIYYFLKLKHFIKKIIYETIKK